MTTDWQPIGAQLSVALLEGMLLISLLLLLFRLRGRLGMAPIYIMIGVLQPVQALLAAGVYFEPLPGLTVSPGSMAFFPIGLVAILLVYIREDADEASKLVYGLVAANLFTALLYGLAAQHVILDGTGGPLSLSAELLTINGRVLAAGTTVLLLDAVLVIILYEALGRYLRSWLLPRILATLAVILVFDSVAFATIAFSGSDHFLPVLAGGGLGKLGMGLLYGSLLFVYLRFAEPRELDVGAETPIADIFQALTYREKYEKAQLETLRATRHAGERVNSILEATIDAILLLDDSERITDHNAAARRVFAAGDEDLAGCNVRELLKEEDRQRFAEHLERVRAGDSGATGRILELEARRVSNRSLFPAELTLASATIGNEASLVVSLRDVTELKHLRDELLQAQKLESVGRLAGGIAHDFNNVLTAVYGHAQLARAGMPDGSPLEVHILGIEEASQRAADLTQQLLAFARTRPAAPRVIDINRSLRRTESLLRRLIGDDIIMVTRLNDVLYPVEIDPLALDQVLINLAVNGRDAMTGGGTLTIETTNVTLSPENGSGLEPGDYAAISVSDTGSGMSPEVLEHIFEPFYTTKESSGGTGLGLATCFGIASQSGGRIEAASVPGEGTTIRLLLPRSHGAPSDIDEPSRPVSRRGHERILFVEDHAEARVATSQALRDLGYRVRTASSGAQALGIVESESRPFDLLITDIVMPGMRGTDLSRILRRQQPHLKVLLVTGHVDDDVRRHLQQPHVHLLNKPFRPDQLSVVVREILGAPGRPAVRPNAGNGAHHPN